MEEKDYELYNRIILSTVMRMVDNNEIKTMEIDNKDKFRIEGHHGGRHLCISYGKKRHHDGLWLQCVDMDTKHYLCIDQYHVDTVMFNMVHDKLTCLFRDMQKYYAMERLKQDNTEELFDKLDNEDNTTVVDNMSDDEYIDYIKPWD